jgi:hypothetical protein
MTVESDMGRRAEVPETMCEDDDDADDDDALHNVVDDDDNSKKREREGREWNLIVNWSLSIGS